jgi:hypothetical protein
LDLCVSYYFEIFLNNRENTDFSSSVVLGAVSYELFVSERSARLRSLSPPFPSEDANRSRGFGALDDGHSVQNVA